MGDFRIWPIKINDLDSITRQSAKFNCNSTRTPSPFNL